MDRTDHFRQRASQRGLRVNVLSFVLAHGTLVNRAGARFVTILRREIPPGVDHELVERALGWVVVVSHDGAPMTCYRRQHAYRYVRRKTRLDLRRQLARRRRPRGPGRDGPPPA